MYPFSVRACMSSTELDLLVTKFFFTTAIFQVFISWLETLLNCEPCVRKYCIGRDLMVAKFSEAKFAGPIMKQKTHYCALRSREASMESSVQFSWKIVALRITYPSITLPPHAD